MKLILIGSTQFGKFFPDFMLPLLYIYLLNLLCFGKELEVQEMPERLLHG